MRSSVITMTPARKFNASTQVTIASVADKSLTVKGRQSTTNYQIDSKTLIRINGRSGSIGDLKPGMAVEVGAGSSYPQRAYSIVVVGSK